ncbi:MAG: redoxin domain-containing protein [Maioricimonas sp. JB045]
MRFIAMLTLTVGALASVCDRPAVAQRMRAREREFLTLTPRVGERLPDVEVYTADGKPFRTSDLRGHYTVLTFGCLTCPPSIWNIAGLEAVHRDYAPRGVRFFFIYKSLAHPELAGNYVQPFTIEERLAQARQAATQFGTRIPWVVDAMDNRLKHALGDRPNSQFLIDPDGVVVSKRHWSHPGLVRKELEERIGPVEQITRVEDLQLNLKPVLAESAPRGVVERIPRLDLRPLVIEPQSGGRTFYAKLRAEADDGLLRSGAGKLYLGFHLDPFHNAHWNNLTEPLSFQIEAEDDVELEYRKASAGKVEAATDSDPREFLLKVAAWPEDKPLTLTVTYFACVGETSCHVLRQKYVIHRRRDIDGGGARGAGPGYWDANEFAERLLAGDRNNDGRLERNEAVGLLLPHFDQLDTDDDGRLDRNELEQVTDWLNHVHRPGPGILSGGTSSGN